MKKPVPINVAIKSSKNPERLKNPRENLSKQALGTRFGCTLFLY
jgi:hypothetical protein